MIRGFIRTYCSREQEILLQLFGLGSCVNGNVGGSGNEKHLFLGGVFGLAVIAMMLLATIVISEGNGKNKIQDNCTFQEFL